MLKSQQELNFSQYTDLYDKLIPQNHLFRKINELIDFSFIRDELKDKYYPDNGRTAEDPEYLFKFLFLKCLHPMSDIDLVERALYDLSYKYFLGLNPTLQQPSDTGSPTGTCQETSENNRGNASCTKSSKNHYSSNNYKRRKA